MKLRHSLFISGAIIAAGIALAYAQGGLSLGYPIAGKASYCASTTNNVCTSTIAAGPVSLTGNEVFLADTGLTGGQNPQTIGIPIGLATLNSQGAFRNGLIGGDFNTNLWQRGTTFTAATPTTAAYTADRWAMYSSGNTVTITRQTGASDISTTFGMLATMRVNRPSGTDITPICVGQVLPAKDASRYLGNNAVFSFYAMAPTTLSSLNDSVDITIAYATAADSATVNTNTDAFFKGTITGYTVASTANIPLTQSFARYYTNGTIPITATTVGVKICMTPLASTGASTDWFEFGNAQLEAAASGIVVPGSFSRRSPAYEAILQQSYSFGLVENTNVIYAGGVLCSATANAWIAIQYPTQMRMTPTVAVTAGGFSIRTAAAVTAIGTTTLLAATPQHATLTSAAACTTTLPYQLHGTNTTGLLLFSAEP